MQPLLRPTLAPYNFGEPIKKYYSIKMIQMENYYILNIVLLTTNHKATPPTLTWSQVCLKYFAINIPIVEHKTQAVIIKAPCKRTNILVAAVNSFISDSKNASCDAIRPKSCVPMVSSVVVNKVYTTLVTIKLHLINCLYHIQYFLLPPINDMDWYLN